MTETIYIPLQNEDLPVQRPVEAYRTPDGKYIILRPPTYDPAHETWKFPPGTTVECEYKTDNGQKFLSAVRPAALTNATPTTPTPTPRDPHLRKKINLLTLTLASIYFVLTLCLFNGTFRATDARDAGLFTLLLGPLVLFGGMLFMWLTFAVQLACVNTLANRIAFRWNALISIIAGPFAAVLILRTLFFLHSLFS